MFCIFIILFIFDVLELEMGNKSQYILHNAIVMNIYMRNIYIYIYIYINYCSEL
jgi:hypothetical protein